MTEVKQWRVIFTEYDIDHGKPTAEAFANAPVYDSLRDAVEATADGPPGHFPWIAGDDEPLLAPWQISPLRLQYRP